MINDPSDPSGDDRESVENRKTRLIMRPDVVEQAPSASRDGTEPASGTIIGSARLAGAPRETPASPASKDRPSAPTRILREDTIEVDAPVAGWIVVVNGPGRGGFRPVYVGMNSVGRAPSQRIVLDFGDETISREEHAFITYDDETRTFYLQHGGKSNLVRLGDAPVLAPTVLKPNDHFRIGNTTFRFVPCCGPDFCWTTEGESA